MEYFSGTEQHLNRLSHMATVVKIELNHILDYLLFVVTIRLVRFKFVFQNQLHFYWLFFVIFQLAIYCFSKFLNGNRLTCDNNIVLKSELNM